MRYDSAFMIARAHSVETEWQGRLSEYVHILLWTDEPVPQVTQNAGMRTKMTSSLVSDIIEKAETVTSAYLPNLEIALENSAQKPNGQSKSELGKRNAAEVIQREPTILSTNMDQNEKRELYDLISTCQFHICSA